MQFVACNLSHALKKLTWFATVFAIAFQSSPVASWCAVAAAAACCSWAAAAAAAAAFAQEARLLLLGVPCVVSFLLLPVSEYCVPQFHCHYASSACVDVYTFQLRVETQPLQLMSSHERIFSCFLWAWK